jgi:MFS family permease
VVYAGAQFGTIISMPLSGLLAEYSWPLIFYVFGAMGVIWSVLFLWTVYEDPQSNPKISDSEKNYINTSIWGTGVQERSPKIPWGDVLTSMPFYAILFAHVCLITSQKENYLNNFISTDGTKLRLRISHDRIANLYETNPEVFYQRGEHFYTFTNNNFKFHQF